MTRPFFIRAITGSALVLVAIGARPASFTPLGDLPGGDFNSRAFAVSADGTVVVGSSKSEHGTEAFRYANGVMTGLGDVPGMTTYASIAYGVSADGATIIGQSGEWGTSAPQAFLYRNGAMSGLGTLPVSYAGAFSIARAISDDGSVIVGESSSEDGVRAVIYRNGAWIDIGDSSFAERSSASAVSPNGTVVAGNAIGGPIGAVGQAFRYSGGVTVGIGDVPSLPQDVSTDGSVIVGASFINTSDTLGEAFRYSNGVMTRLGFLPLPDGSFKYSWANGVSADGNIVVGGSTIVTRGESTIAAFIWTEAHGMLRLQDLLVAQGVSGLNYCCWALNDARAISADGRTIVGLGRNPQGKEEAWIATIDAPTAPDVDNDDVFDALDNCVNIGNPDQFDADDDGYGNVCDADLNNSGTVTTGDFALLRSVLNQSSSSSPLAAAADLNRSGTVTTGDLTILRNRLNTAPGPSSLHP